MRVLHWFNVLSWLLLIVTGTALMTAPAFALFGTSGPHALSRLVGGQPNLIRLHALWGLMWAAVIVPLFLVFKKGGLEALREIWLTPDDFVWLMRKPWVALGLTTQKLPKQDKYNAGQKLFAASALAGTATIIASGVVMTFHLGPAPLVSAMILVHKLAIALALVGLAVHITMAALVREERPALASMITGRVSREHAMSHATRWAEEVASENGHDGAKPRSVKHE
jgi:sulfite dehydrogenase (quinone) subunit SoeB